MRAAVKIHGKDMVFPFCCKELLPIDGHFSSPKKSWSPWSAMDSPRVFPTPPPPPPPCSRVQCSTMIPFSNKITLSHPPTITTHTKKQQQHGSIKVHPLNKRFPLYQKFRLMTSWQLFFHCCVESAATLLTITSSTNINNTFKQPTRPFYRLLL